MKPPYIVVSEKENLADRHFLKMELPRNKKLPLKVLKNRFPGCVGLWYRSEETCERQDVPEDGKENLVFRKLAQRYYCIYRQGMVGVKEAPTDLIAFGLPSRATREEVALCLSESGHVEALGKIEGEGPSKFIVFRCSDARSTWDICFRRHMLYGHWVYVRPLETEDIRGLGVGDMLLIVPASSTPAYERHTCEDVLPRLAEREIRQRLNLGARRRSKSADTTTTTTTSTTTTKVKSPCIFCNKLIALMRKSNEGIKELLERFTNETESSMLESCYKTVTEEGLQDLLRKLKEQDLRTLKSAVQGFRVTPQIAEELEERREHLEKLKHLTEKNKWEACTKLLEDVADEYARWKTRVVEQLKVRSSLSPPRSGDLNTLLDMCKQPTIRFIPPSRVLANFFGSRSRLLRVRRDPKGRFALLHFRNALDAQRWGYRNLDVAGAAVYTHPVILNDSLRTKFLRST